MTGRKPAPCSNAVHPDSGRSAANASSQALLVQQQLLTFPRKCEHPIVLSPRKDEGRCFGEASDPGGCSEEEMQIVQSSQDDAANGSIQHPKYLK